MITGSSSRMDLSFLHVVERERVLEVLQRDKVLRSIEENRIRSVILDSIVVLLGWKLEFQMQVKQTSGS